MSERVVLDGALDGLAVHSSVILAVMPGTIAMNASWSAASRSNARRRKLCCASRSAAMRALLAPTPNIRVVDDGGAMRPMISGMIVWSPRVHFRSSGCQDSVTLDRSDAKNRASPNASPTSFLHSFASGASMAPSSKICSNIGLTESGNDFAWKTGVAELVVMLLTAAVMRLLLSSTI